MASSKWVVVLEDQKVMEAEAGPVLAFLRTLDPFISALEDGMEVSGHLVCRATEPTIERTEEEKALWSFTSTLHTQIHNASDAAGRGETNQAMALLFLVRDRINHFLSNKTNPTEKGS